MTTLTCYRHPRREATIRCTRCERPICTDCMHPAAVGFHCPECVAEARRTVRQRRTIAGGRVGGNPMAMSMTLIGVFVVVYVLQQSVGDFEIRFMDLVIGVANGEYYRLITSAFLHANTIHLLFNSYALYFVGPRVDAIVGRLRFGVLFIVSAFGGSVVSYLTHPLASASVGASGAVFGLFGATYVVLRRLRGDTGQITGLLVLNLALGFLLPFINWQAHLGGLVTGAALTAAFVYTPPRWRTAGHVVAVAAVLLLLAAMVVLRTQALTS